MKRSARALALVAVVAVLALPILTGCAPAVYPNASQTNIPATPGASSTASPSLPAPPPPPTPTSTKSPSHADPGPHPCDATRLQVSYIASNNNAAGKFYGTLDFRNTSPAACVGYGFPRVWFSDGYNDVGPEASDTPGAAAQIVTLQPNQWMTSQIVFTDADFIDGCTVVQVANLDVRPPGADNDIIVPIPPTDACSNGVSVISATAAALK